MENIRVGTVTDNADPTRRGMIAVSFDGSIDGSEWVWYGTPYGGGHHSGFGAIPEVGTRVLCCKPDNDNSYHFLSCTTAPSPMQGHTGRPVFEDFVTTDNLGFNPKLYKFSPAPMSYGITTPLKNQILLKDDRNSERMDMGVRVKSQTGKTLSLNDSPGVDAIILSTGNQMAGIKITEGKVKEGIVGPNSIYSACKGSSTMVSREGNIVLEVGSNGKELQLVNKSSVKHGKAPYNKASANIKIRTDNGNIIIETFDVDGGVFIDNKGGPDSTVQVRSRGNVGVFASQGINLRSAGEVNIEADENINIMSHKDVNIKGSKIKLNDPDHPDTDMSIKLNNWDQMKNEDGNYSFFSEDSLEDLNEEQDG